MKRWLNVNSSRCLMPVAECFSVSSWVAMRRQELPVIWLSIRAGWLFATFAHGARARPWRGIPGGGVVPHGYRGGYFSRDASSERVLLGEREQFQHHRDTEEERSAQLFLSKAVREKCPANGQSGSLPPDHGQPRIFAGGVVVAVSHTVHAESGRDSPLIDSPLHAGKRYFLPQISSSRASLPQPWR